MFPSDVEDIRAVIRRKIRDTYEYKDKDGRADGVERKAGGYYAVHYVLSRPSPTYAQVWCEVQLKTILSDGWTWKTHDLTYKNQGELEGAFRHQTRILGTHLRMLDEESEILKEKITRAWQEDRRRKQAACLIHRNFLLKTDQTPSVTNSVQIIVNAIESGCTVANEQSILEAANKCRERHEYETEARLKLMMTFSGCNVSLADAVYSIEKWIEAAGDDWEQDLRARLVQATTLFLFGRVEDAIERIEEIARRYEADFSPGQGARVYANLAYYYASLIHSRTGELIEAQQRAEEFVEKARSFAGNIKADEDKKRMRTRIDDTEGYVAIMSGESENEIFNGLQLCKSARHNSPEADVADLYYQVHERIAWQRILQMRR